MNKLVEKWGSQILSRAKCRAIACIHGGITVRCSGGHVRDSFDYTHLLHQSRTTKSLKQIHAQIIIGGYELNRFVATKLVGKYSEFGNSSMSMVDARKVFDKMPERDVFLWNIIIRGYSKYGVSEQVLSCFDQLRTTGIAPNEYTLPMVLKAVGGMKEMKMMMKKGQVIHGHIIKSGLDSDIKVYNALLALYGKCQSAGLSMSRKVFDVMPQKDVVSWNSMISAYVANGAPGEALELFHVMMVDATISPDNATLVGLLPACAQQATVKEGLWIHSRIIRSGMELDAALGSGLISMYANTGRLKSAKLIFDQVTDKNIVVWNTIIRAYGTHGHADKALHMLSQMLESGLRPDAIIFLCLLSACSHAGMVSEGSQLFHQMESYGIDKIPQHYACMIDLYSRAGLIDDAIKLIDTMPVQAGKDAYGALLGACRIHNNIELAEEVAKKLFDLDPENPGRYLILVKMYEDTGRHEDAARLRKTLREKNIRRPIGYSEIELDYSLHRFGVGVESHPLKEQIIDTLHKLELVIEDER